MPVVAIAQGAAGSDLCPACGLDAFCVDSNYVGVDWRSSTTSKCDHCQRMFHNSRCGRSNVVQQPLPSFSKTNPQTPNPKPQTPTLNPSPKTPNPNPQTPNPQTPNPQTRNAESKGVTVEQMTITVTVTVLSGGPRVRKIQGSYRGADDHIRAPTICPLFKDHSRGAHSGRSQLPSSGARRWGQMLSVLSESVAGRVRQA